jgi:hypothetical protein
MAPFALCQNSKLKMDFFKLYLDSIATYDCSMQFFAFFSMLLQASIDFCNELIKDGIEELLGVHVLAPMRSSNIELISTQFKLFPS